MSFPTTWFYVADRSRAMVFEAVPSGLRLVHSFDEPAIRQHVSDLMTGKRGRRRDDGNGRSAMDRQTSVQQTEVDRFVNDLAEWLHLEADAGSFDRMLLVAGPQMLGDLRPLLTSPVAERIVGSLDKVYTTMPLPDLEKHLRSAFPEFMHPESDDVPSIARSGNQQPTT
jgi:protein required for attachment to host cells